MCRVRLRHTVEGGLYDHAQSYIHTTLMMGVFSSVCSGVFWGRGGLQCRILGGVITLSNRPKFMYLLCIICFISYTQSLQWWFRCMRLQTCVGSVCVGDTTLMCHGRECARLGSTTRRVSFYASMVGGGLRLSRPSSGSNSRVRVYRRVIFGK